MNKPAKIPKQDRYAPASTWAQHKAAVDRRLLRLAWILAGCAVLVAVLEAIAIAVMSPLKTTIPYTILVDRQTGHTVLLDPDQAIRVDPQSALNQSVLARYVEARESYDWSATPRRYQEVMSWSGANVRARYAAHMRSDNPDSPVARFARNGTVTTEILSVTPVDADTAMVRFRSVTEAAGAGRNSSARWMALIDYRFVPRPMSLEERFINPLGLEVTKYARSPEAGSVDTVVEVEGIE